MSHALGDACPLNAIITRLYDKEWVLEYSTCVTELVAKLAAFMNMRVHTKLRDKIFGSSSLRLICQKAFSASNIQTCLVVLKRSNARSGDAQVKDFW